MSWSLLKCAIGGGVDKDDKVSTILQVSKLWSLTGSWTSWVKHHTGVDQRYVAEVVKESFRVMPLSVSFVGGKSVPWHVYLYSLAKGEEV